ncbi:OLC1v1018315C1 [Oldenlandia corymbosa var. corymbosa]|uniref:glutathione transferase n=1 Tax=Oldenlandia corymbosa var. corymbosa TaxID=529605 RepID=A0AAV1EBE3_OLDCO|nr:OLC1v1018315C1 [Oldenlandia corymbosa var. corymbosa]
MATLPLPVKVYGPPLSPAVSRVLVCLLEKNVQFQLVPVNMAKGEHKTPDYLKIQPFGQVPAFQDDSISVFESRAICRYVCDKYANQGNESMYSNNPLVKASIEQWIESEAQNFNPPSSILVFQLLFASRMGIKQDENVIKTNKEKLSKVLDVYEKRLSESPYLAGDEFTLADLFHLPNTQFLAGEDEMFSTTRKNVGRWWDEISSRESWKKVVEMQNQNFPAPKV